MTMFAVIFEVQPKQERWTDYLDLAGILRPELEKIDGFIDNERFTSLRDRGRVLSLSIWRDEKALIRWRTLSLHHDAQEQGRAGIFADYHLRVGEVVADTHVPKDRSLPHQRFDETETGAAKLVTISEFRMPGDSGAGTDALAGDLGLPTVETSSVVSHEAFTGITDPAKSLLLVSWRDHVIGQRWQPDATGGIDIRHRAVRVIRDYGMHDRREAPQYYRAIESDAERP
jgi:heme-degrading monooxygenase HmoA